jgi:hypothetical protein
MVKEPKLSDVKQVRTIVYGLLHRNIRWTDGFHQWMFALDRLPLTTVQKKKLGFICKNQPFTGSGQTVPCYRIPILWENYLSCIRNALAPPPPPKEPQPTEPIKKMKTLRKKKGEHVASSS